MLTNGVSHNSHKVSFDSGMESFFRTFDKRGKSKLNLHDFKLLCQTLFQNANQESYSIEDQYLKEMFDVFDRDQNGFIDQEEFAFCWNSWITTVFKPVSAFLIVDVQNDFISGSLSINKCPAKQNGADIIEPINQLLKNVHFDAVFYSLDWHPNNHISFIDNVNQRPVHHTSSVAAENAHIFDTITFAASPQPIEQKLWPKHCVQNSWGAELHNNLKIVDGAIKIYKGTNPDVDSYSAFWDNNKIGETTLREQLERRNITDIYLCGLAYDVCVGATAADALALGYRTILVNDCSRGVDSEAIEKTKAMVVANHGVVVDSNEVAAMVRGKDRKPELGYKLALKIRENLGK